MSDAIRVGYRSIDTAQAYGNEAGVGAAWRKRGLSRDELFLTTKVWITNAGEEKATASIDASLKALQTDYVDLLLIHQPFGDYDGTYRSMAAAQKVLSRYGTQIESWGPFSEGRNGGKLQYL